MRRLEMRKLLILDVNSKGNKDFCEINFRLVTAADLNKCLKQIELLNSLTRVRIFL